MANVGLNFDLSAWRNGIRRASNVVKTGLGPAVMRPFDRAWDATIGRMRRGFRAFTGGISNMMKSALGPVVAFLGVRAVANRLVGAFRRGMDAVRDYDDSLTVVRRSLQAMGVQDVDGATSAISKLAQHLRRTMGVAVTETNKAFSQLLTRGFDERQAERLTVLAANMAKQTGQPIEDIVRRIADAADGSVSGLRRLGVQIDATGDAATDGARAMDTLWAQFGGVGGELVNPSEQLAAAWEQVYLVLGQKLAPILEPLIQYVADFVEGLSNTEAGEAALERVVGAFKGVVEWVKMVIRRISNFVEVVRVAGDFIVGLWKSIFPRLLSIFMDFLGRIPGLNTIMRRLGFDPDSISSYFGGVADAGAEQMSGAMDKFGDVTRQWLNDERGGIAAWVDDVADAGRKAREKSLKELARGQEEARDMSFLREQQRQQMEEARSQQGRGATFSGRGDLDTGRQVAVRIISTRPDRFRRARFA